MAWLYGKPINENNFMHTVNGYTFVSKRCDLDGGVAILIHSRAQIAKVKYLMEAMAGMAGWHAVNIRPELNGFRGYDCQDYTFVMDEMVDEENNLCDLLIDGKLTYEDFFSKYVDNAPELIDKALGEYSV